MIAAIAIKSKVSTPFGKVFRVNDDGSIPADNPLPCASSRRARFGVDVRPSQPTRARSRPELKVLWETEHGPKGGDELNALHKGANYGWPILTYGIDDDGSIISNETSRPGMQDPAKPGRLQFPRAQSR